MNPLAHEEAKDFKSALDFLTQQRSLLMQKLFSSKALPTTQLHGNKRVIRIHEKECFI